MAIGVGALLGPSAYPIGLGLAISSAIVVIAVVVMHLAEFAE